MFYSSSCSAVEIHEISDLELCDWCEDVRQYNL